MRLPAMPAFVRRARLPIVLLLLVGVLHGLSAPPARAISSTVVISEFRVRGPNGGNDEFIELYNLSASPVDIGGWKVNGSNASGTTGTRATIAPGTVLPPGAHYLLTNMATGAHYSGTVPGNQTYTTGITDDGGIALLSGNTIVDQVGMSVGSAYKEGTPLATLGSSNQNRGYERKPGGVAGSTTDTDNNATDFQLISPSDPQNLPATNPTATGAAAPAIESAEQQRLLTVAVTPGNYPPSTGLAVSVDLTPIGGSATQPLFDDGTNGDAVAGDRTFSLLTAIAAATPLGAKTLLATVTDAQGRTAHATMALTVAPFVVIHDVQGPGSASPYAGQAVATSGIVTGVKTSGFFIQTPDDEADADPSTSEGILVYTGGAPPAAAAVGNEVRVGGMVQEYVPTADPYSPPLTEIGSPSVSLVSTGHPLPQPVVLTTADTDPAGTLEQLERLEGMRVKVDSLTVIGPTQGSINEPTASSTSNGVFYGVLTGLARPFREPGVQLPDPLPPGAPCCVPRFDGNPERLRVDGDALLGAVPLEVSAGAVVSGLTGPLEYAYRTYTVDADPASASISDGLSATPVPAAAADEFTVASFNLQRFFDTSNDADTQDVVLTPAAFERRLSKASLAIREVLRAPDVVGVMEMENLETLQTLAARLNGDAVAAGQGDPGYVGYLEEGNDIGGIDVGFLVKTGRVTVQEVTQHGKDTTYTNPATGQQELLNDRPPLLLRAAVNRTGATPFPITVIVNHLRSLSGVSDTVDGDRVRHKRRAQAEYLAELVQARQAADPAEHIVLVGDFNAYPFSDGYVDSIGTILGTPAPEDQVVLASGDLVEPDLVNLADTVAPAERYSYVYDGQAQELDHVLATANLLDRLRGLHYGRSNADFPDSLRNDPGRPERLSDHDPLLATFSFPPEADLSLAMAAAPDPVLTGAALSWDLTVSNAGPDAAADVVLSDTLPAGSELSSFSAPAGWTCTPGAGSVSCTTASLPAATSATVRLTASVSCGVADGALLTNTASVVSTTADPAPGGETASLAVTASNPAPVISGFAAGQPLLWPPNHALVPEVLSFGLTDNCSAVPACTVAVSSNEPVNGTGDGDTAPDWLVQDATHVSLRAERAGGGGGRVYTLLLSCTDAGGGRAQATTLVRVPKSAR